MKTLVLLRHAKSGMDADVGRDFDRTLSPKGHRAARTVGRMLADEEIGFDAVLASPAMRVRETLDGVSAGLGRDVAPRFERALYLAAPDTILELVQETDDGVERLMVAGHNPGLEQLVLLLTPEAPGDRLRGTVEEKFPTASVAVIEFDTAHWGDLRPGAGRLARFVRPRDLDPALGPDGS